MIDNNKKFGNKTIFVTGAAGFIGSNLVLELMKDDEIKHIIGLDNMNDYYDVSLKEFRLEQIENLQNDSTTKWTFIKGSIADRELVENIFSKYKRIL